MKKRGFSFKEEYKKAGSYLKESRNLIFVSIAIFILAIVIGVFIQSSAFLDDLLKQMIEKSLNYHGIGLILYILYNNAWVALLSIFLGLLFGVFPVIFSFFNGVIVGYAIRKVVAIAGYSEIWRLLPHGIFELPAIFISFGLGMKLGGFIFGKSMWEEFKRRFSESIRVFVLIIIPLLIVAAIIEGLLIIFFS
jgi:stage II sporulation protein M